MFLTLPSGPRPFVLNVKSVTPSYGLAPACVSRSPGVDDLRTSALNASTPKAAWAAGAATPSVSTAASAARIPLLFMSPKVVGYLKTSFRLAFDEAPLDGLKDALSFTDSFFLRLLCLRAFSRALPLLASLTLMVSVPALVALRVAFLRPLPVSVTRPAAGTRTFSVARLPLTLALRIFTPQPETSSGYVVFSVFPLWETIVAGMLSLPAHRSDVVPSAECGPRGRSSWNRVIGASGTAAKVELMPAPRPIVLVRFSVMPEPERMASRVGSCPLWPTR